MYRYSTSSVHTAFKNVFTFNFTHYVMKRGNTSYATFLKCLFAFERPLEVIFPHTYS